MTTTTMTPITLADLTSGAVGGNGVFDVLMRANKAHLDEQFTLNRITGADYAKAYVAMIESTMQGAISFLVERDQIALKAELLKAQICKLQAEFDLTMETITKTGKENDLLVQKTLTEKAQTQDLGVDDNSVIGKQKRLYQAQTDGFARDAEQKTVKVMVDSWNARRMTDDGTVADGVNKLADEYIGRAITKMFEGVNI